LIREVIVFTQNQQTLNYQSIQNEYTLETKKGN